MYIVFCVFLERIPIGSARTVNRFRSFSTMADDPDLLDYDENADTAQQQPAGAKGKPGGPMRGTYVSIHASGFKDFLLKPELLRAIMDCGFEHPSEGSFRSSNYHSWTFLSFGQFNTNRFLKPFSARTSSVKRSQAWAKQRCSFWLLSNN